MIINNGASDTRSVNKVPRFPVSRSFAKPRSIGPLPRSRHSRDTQPRRRKVSFRARIIISLDSLQISRHADAYIFLFDSGSMPAASFTSEFRDCERGDRDHRFHGRDPPRVSFSFARVLSHYFLLETRATKYGEGDKAGRIQDRKVKGPGGRERGG